jgi:hypothetical protein
MPSPLEVLEKNIKKQGFINGLILGVATTILSIISFYFITAPSASAVGFIMLPIALRLFVPIFLVLYLCFNVRNKIGGLWTFKQATTGIFIMLFTAYLINLAGKDLLFDKVVEPNGIEKTQVAAVNAKTSDMKQHGYNQAKIDSSITDMKKDFSEKDSFSVGKFITGNVFIILFLFVIALIFASLIRNAEYVSADHK